MHIYYNIFFFIFTSDIYYCQEDENEGLFEKFCIEFLPELRIHQIKEGSKCKNICLVYLLPEINRKEKATDLRKETAEKLIERHDIKGIHITVYIQRTIPT